MPEENPDKGTPRIFILQLNFPGLRCGLLRTNKEYLFFCGGCAPPNPAAG
jgi:hypothetical protein